MPAIHATLYPKVWFPMKTFKSFLILCALVTGALFSTSCGYHMGSMMHPQIQTIAIADIRNDSREPLLTAFMRQQLAEQIMVDGSLKLVSKEKADCILYCHIANVQSRTVREDSDDGKQETYRPSEINVTVNGEFTVLIPGRSEPLIPKRKISGNSNYQYESDPQITRISGLKQACYNFARMAVQYTTEAW